MTMRSFTDTKSLRVQKQPKIHLIRTYGFTDTKSLRVQKHDCRCS